MIDDVSEKCETEFFWKVLQVMRRIYLLLIHLGVKVHVTLLKPVRRTSFLSSIGRLLLY